MKKIIAIGCDHAGFELKIFLIKTLEKDFEIKNFGTDSADSVDYPDYVHPLCSAIEKGEVEFGILICGSANGVCMTANKHQNVRAALCWKNEIATLARQHNNANVICLPSRFISENEAMTCVKIFLTTDFERGRHEKRVEKIPMKK